MCKRTHPGTAPVFSLSSAEGGEGRCENSPKQFFALGTLEPGRDGALRRPRRRAQRQTTECLGRDMRQSEIVPPALSRGRGHRSAMSLPAAGSWAGKSIPRWGGGNAPEVTARARMRRKVWSAPRQTPSRRFRTQDISPALHADPERCRRCALPPHSICTCRAFWSALALLGEPRHIPKRPRTSALQDAIARVMPQSNLAARGARHGSCSLSAPDNSLQKNTSA